jgi:hypothetical protein
LYDAWLTPLHDHQRQETAAWIQQLAASQKLLLPWAPGDLKWASIMASTQAKCVALLHFTVPGKFNLTKIIHSWLLLKKLKMVKGKSKWIRLIKKNLFRT